LAKGWKNFIEVMDTGDFRVSLSGFLLTVRRQYRKALANAGCKGTFKHREAVINHQGIFSPIGRQALEIVPERRVFLGLAKLMAGYNGIHSGIQAGTLELQGQGVRVAVGDNHRLEPG
jgi:hypothetical protein